MRGGPIRTDQDLADYMAEYTVKMRGENPDLDDHPDHGPESRLQSRCEKWLRNHGYKYIHDRSRKKNQPGIPDLICFLPEGRVVCIELKSQKGELRKEQAEWKRILKYLKHEYHTVKSYKRFLEVVNG